MFYSLYGINGFIQYENNANHLRRYTTTLLIPTSFLKCSSFIEI
jgi:hypothetical protein